MAVTAQYSPLYSISGTVSGDVQQGVTLALSGTASATTTSNADGSYSFANLANGSYTVTANLEGYSFEPQSIQVEISGANQTGKNFVATAIIPGTYSISGTVSGDVQAGVTITLSGAATGTANTFYNGTYAFTGLGNGTYTLTPSLEGYTFVPSSITVTINGANQTGNDFTATLGGGPKYEKASILKIAFRSSYKDTVKNNSGQYVKFSLDRFVFNAEIQFNKGVDLNKIDGETEFYFSFGEYECTFGKLKEAAKKKFNGDKGGSATFLRYEYDEIRGRQVVAERIVMKWNKNKKLTLRISGTPPCDEMINLVDISVEEDGTGQGAVDSFSLVFQNAEAKFAENQTIKYFYKKSTKMSKELEGEELMSWTAAGKTDKNFKN